MSIENIPMATQEDMAAIDRLIKPQEPPERIYGWLDSQLSVARYYGGCQYNGHHYSVSPTEDGAPLVRDDVLKREAKKAKAERDAANQLAAQRLVTAQGRLL